MRPPRLRRVAAAFACQGLEKRYGATVALGGVDLDVEPGELVGLLGPNGAGKSTLVKIACGLVRAGAGEATVAGAPAGSAEARAAIGYLAELFRFPDWLRAGELLDLHQRLPAPMAASASARTCSRWSASGTRRGRASTPCPRECSSGSASPRRSWAPRGCSARRAHQRARPRGPADRPRPAARAQADEGCRAAELASAERGRARLRPGGDPRRRAHHRARAPRRSWRARAASRSDVDGDARSFPEAAARAGARDRGRLVAAGERVYGVRVLASTLEDTYLEAVEGPRERRRDDCPVRPARVDSPARVRGRARPHARLPRRSTPSAPTAAFDAIGDIGGEAPVDDEVLTGSTLLGLAMFTTLFLGACLPCSSPSGAVRGDAERGLLQPLVVRPLGRSALLAGRFAAAAGVSRRLRGGRVHGGAADHRRRRRVVARPPRRARSGAGRGSRDLVAALSLLGSVLPVRHRERHRRVHDLRRRPRGGLLGQIGDALSVDSLQTVAERHLLAAALRGALPGAASTP